MIVELLINLLGIIRDFRNAINYQQVSV